MLLINILLSRCALAPAGQGGPQTAAGCLLLLAGTTSGSVHRSADNASGPPGVTLQLLGQGP